MNFEKKRSRLIPPDIRALKAYHVPDAAGMVKLDAPWRTPTAGPKELKREWIGCCRTVSPSTAIRTPKARALRAAPHAALKVPAGMG